MVRPYSRYHELLVKRGMDVQGQDLERVSRQFSTQDLLDLQVWHNLAWFGYGATRRYPRLKALRTKNRNFSEEEKQELLALQRVVVQDVVPSYRRLLERGQIELTTSAFFHPILPLVIDTDTARRARPDLPLPARFSAPEDAEAQLRLAVDFHTATFGQAPAGLWPSEGSVCPEMIPMVARNSLRWLATDEGILVRSLESAQQPWQRHRDLYQPYRVGPDGQAVTIVFRDRDISDAFGFVYHKTTVESAADDVLRRLRGIVNDAPQEEVVVSVILDGENPWEHYYDGGDRFLSLLYTALSQHTLNHDELHVATSTISEALAAIPAPPQLTQLHSGSWINQDYKIWIGHQEDNQGWELLGHTRARLRDLAPNLPVNRAQTAWNELYAAEGSDWFWWYGDDFYTTYKEEFDRLFRTHLRNVWTLAGVSPPDLLNQPLCEVRRFHGRDQVTEPLALLHPTLDGLVTDFFEWRGAGTINPHPPLGAMWKADGLFTAISFGCDLEHLYLRLDPEEASQSKRQSLQIECQLHTPAHGYRLRVSLASPDRYSLPQKQEDGNWQDIGSSRLIGLNQVLELALPFKDIHVEERQVLKLTILVFDNGLEIARYPHQQPAAVTVPAPDFEATVWRV